MEFDSSMKIFRDASASLNVSEAQTCLRIYEISDNNVDEANAVIINDPSDVDLVFQNSISSRIIQFETIRFHLFTTSFHKFRRL